MVDLRKAARGQMCTVRIPGYCNHDPETSVLAHSKLMMRVRFPLPAPAFKTSLIVLRHWRIFLLRGSRLF